MKFAGSGKTLLFFSESLLLVPLLWTEPLSSWCFTSWALAVPACLTTVHQSCTFYKLAQSTWWHLLLTLCSLCVHDSSCQQVFATGRKVSFHCCLNVIKWSVWAIKTAGWRKKVNAETSKGFRGLLSKSDITLVPQMLIFLHHILLYIFRKHESGCIEQPAGCRKHT